MQQLAADFDPTLPPPNSQASRAIDHANALEKKGDLDGAIAALSAPISSSNDPRSLCRYIRGEISLEAGHYDSALADFDIILASQLRFVVEALQPAAALRSAYILALRGNDAFEKMIERVPSGETFFIRREILTRRDLQRMYQANCLSRVRPK